MNPTQLLIRADPEWIAARERYLTEFDDTVPADYRFTARVQAIHEMHAIELRYEQVAGIARDTDRLVADTDALEARLNHAIAEAELLTAVLAKRTTN